MGAVPRRRRRQVQPPPAVLTSGGELGGAGPRRGRRLVSTPGGRALGDTVEGGDYFLVGPVGGRGQVPGPPVCVRAQRVGQCPVRGPAFRAACRPVDRGTHQRVVEGQRRAL